MPGQPQPTPASIRRYYDQNTRLFLSLGSSARTQSIHRAVWAPGTRSLEAALDYTNGLVLEQALQVTALRASDRLKLLDLGCGVGGSLAYLLLRLGHPALGMGLTISPLQAQLARRRLAQLNLQQASMILEADFHSVPLDSGFDLAYAIEAFVHASQPERFLAEAARLLKLGGRLVVCDDFLSEEAAQGMHAHQKRWLKAYQGGWYIPNISTLQVTADMAQPFGLGLLQELDLTPHLRLRALPDQLARLLLWSGERLPLKHAILPGMLGSMALQQCLQMGLVRYRFLVFQKTS